MTTASRTILLLCLLACTSPGCVRRRMTVRTNPPGAAVFVDKQYIGTSPAATGYTFYGTREIEVVKDGYQTVRVLRTIHPPWYQVPPLDFFSETLWPRELRDERVIDIAMLPEQPASSEAVLARANSLRLQAAQGIATPLPLAANPANPITGGLAGPILPANPNPIAPQYDPNSAYDPNLPYGGGLPYGADPLGLPSNPPATGNTPWRPGQIIGNLLMPGGQPPQRIPETGILQGGGYRPEIQP